MVKDYEPYSLGSMIRETEVMKPTDKACKRQVSNPTGCNESEPTVSLVRPKHNGRAFSEWAKAAPSTVAGSQRQGRHYRGTRGDMSGRNNQETWETLPHQLSLFERELKTESYKENPKWRREGEGVGAAHSSGDYRDNITRYSEGAAVQPVPAKQGGASDCRKATNGHIKAQDLQRRLYRKSKREKWCRYYRLVA